VDRNLAPDSVEAPQHRTPRWHPWLLVLLIVAGVAYHLPSLRWGFAWDDYVHQMMLRDLVPGRHVAPWDLYGFGETPAPGEPLFETGMFPWWSPPDLKLRFFRPVTSLSIWLDHQVWGAWATGYHLTSLVLFALVLVASYGLFRELGLPPAAGLWPLALLALDDVHTLPVGWIANRNTVLATLFTALAALLALRYERRRATGLLPLIGLSALAACGSKESGVAVLPIVALAVVCATLQNARASWRTAIQRAIRSPAVWIAGVVVLGFLTFYVTGGFGAKSIVYPAPWQDPTGFALRVARVVPIGLLSLFFGISADLAIVRPELTLTFIIAAVILIPLLLWGVVRVTRASPAIIFAGGWLLFALLVEAGGDPSDRLWMNASVGAALLLGLFLYTVGSWRVCWKQRRFLTLGLAVVILLAGPIGAVASLPIRTTVLRDLMVGDRQYAATAEIDRSVPPPRDVIVLNVPTPLLGLTLASTWRVVHDDVDTRIFPLQYGRCGMRIERVDARTLRLTATERPWLENAVEQVFRTQAAPPAIGTRYRTVAFDVEIVAVDDTGVRTLRLELHNDANAPRYQFLAWWDGRLRRIVMPTIGGELQLPTVSPISPHVP
jgi:hypothetical protein